MIRVRRSLCLAALPLAALLAACDAAPGFPAEAARPRITAFALAPAQDSLATAAPRADLTVVGRIDLEGEGPIDLVATVRYAESDALAAEAEVENVGPGRVEVRIPLSLPRGATGEYAVTVATQGPDRRAGDRASAVYTFKAASLGPPSVTATAAATVSRPTSATARPTALPVTATVTDPDGLENIAAVVLQLPNNGGVVVRLYDEGPRGRGTGDEKAGDGIYTNSLGIRSDVPTGPIELEAVAFDRAGTASAPAPVRFTVQ